MENKNSLQDTIQDCNINFLFGSGLSVPYFSTLGQIENWLTKIEKKDIHANLKRFVKASLYKKYYSVAMKGNLGLLNSRLKDTEVLRNYCALLKKLNTLLHKRKSTILGKEINLFTTNIDIFFERALEEVNLEYNDGFNGRFRPIFSLSHFKKSRFKKSLYFDNVAEIPVFNLVKLHGSVTWNLGEDQEIYFSHNLSNLLELENPNASGQDFIEIENDDTIEVILEKATTAIQRNSGTPDHSAIMNFLKSYEKLLVVNPTKEKFNHTLLNQTYYEMLRMYSNELEKENTVLFVAGFSFADEHIREITLRAANSNPTLLVKVYCYNADASLEIKSKFDHAKIKNNNIQFISPDKEEDEEGKQVESYFYNLENLTNKVFNPL